LMRMQPEDLQTAGTINPETRSPEFSTTKPNFVDVAPLGSVENQGVAVNVEASQLSRALTLTEMRVKDGLDTDVDALCNCLLGRSDLAFINVGYQVKFLTGTAPDNTTGGSTSTGTGSPRSAELERLWAQLDTITEELGTTSTLREFSEEYREVSAKIAALEQEFYSESELGAPVSAATFAPSASTISNRVEYFLADLYAALDTPHQELEKAIRGGFLPITSREEALGEPGATPPRSPLSPPFSAIGRAQGGDPAALALQGSQALNGMAEAWQEFGESLQKNPKRAALEGEIERLEKNILDLNAEELRLDQGNNIQGIPDPSERLRTLRENRTKLERDLANVKGRLNKLNNG